MLTEVERIKQLGPMETYNELVCNPEAPKSIRDFMRTGNNGIDIYELDELTVKRKIGIVLYRGESYWLKDVYSDLEERMLLAKKWMIKQLEEEPIARGRT